MNGLSAVATTSASLRQLVSHDGHHANNLTRHRFADQGASHSWLAGGDWSPVKDSSVIVLGAFPLLGREIPNFFILEMRLVLGNPSRAAAPSGPPISQPVSSRVRKIRDRTESLNVPDVQLKVDVF